MHVMEGFLPPLHALAWCTLAAPAVVVGARRVRAVVAGGGDRPLLLGACGAFCMVLSSLKLPSIAGSCSHPTGTGLGAILFGIPEMAVVGMIVLTFQALMLAHGGITTLGANVFSLSIAGPATAMATFVGARRAGLSPVACAFLAGFTGDLATYVTTAFQLSLVFTDPIAGWVPSFVKFLGVFAVAQLPLALAEGILTAAVFNVLRGIEGLSIGALGGTGGAGTAQ